MAAQPEFRLEPFSYAEARALERELGVAEPVAVALVRRGYRTPEAARVFLAADESHDPGEFGSMEEVAGRIRAAIAAGVRITVHGDYDVDGVSSATAILVGALRRLGADCDWFVPDRLRDGYGLTRGSVERLAERGSELIVTVDCGIASTEAVAHAAELGVPVVVTDHHEPGKILPDCPILHPRLDGYPFGELCGAGVAWKLATALAGEGYAQETLDLVALATVADMVPLTGENRSLVRRGLRVARRAQRPGIRALCAAAGVDPVHLDESHIGFRLGPRINAAGRLYRADAAVELLLTGDMNRATAIAAELDLANQERREAERAAVDGAEGARRELGPDAPKAALVLAGHDWHVGVVGIAASRLVERHGVPVVLIGLDEQGRGRGSARSVPGFDLLAGLDACAEHLTRYGGHRAAAGLEIQADSVEAFRQAFAAHVAATRGDEPAPRAETIDAIVGAESLGLGVAQQFEQLAPFGMGNPEVRLLVPGARLGDIRPMGKDERHARFTLASGSRRALGVAFGTNGKLGAAVEANEPLDVSLRLEVNEWNGAVEPRVVLGNLYPPAAAAPEEEAAGPYIDDAEWWARFDAELEEPAEPARAAPREHALRDVVDRRGASGVAAVASLVSAGGPLLVLACDALRRRALVELAAPPARFGGGGVALLSGRLPRAEARSGVEELFAAGTGVALADWATLAGDPDLARRFTQILAIDPPSSAALEAPALLALSGEERGYLHLGWGDAEINLATRVHEAEWPSRPVLAAVFRALREAAAGELLARASARSALEGPGPFPRGPEVAARCVRVLSELGLMRRVPESHDGVLGVVSSEATELERSAAFVAYRRHCEEGTKYLNEQRQAS